MATATVYFRGGRFAAEAILGKIPQVLTGKARDDSGLAYRVQVRIANAVLSKIRQAFVVKARGGTDEAGITWKPLKRETIAQRRSTASERKALGVGGRRVRGFLTPAQDKLWRAIFRSRFVALAPRVGPREAAAIAGAVAWSILKKHGAKTKLDVLGGRSVEMLRDTGVLFNSLSPGVEEQPSRAAENVTDIRPGEIIVGSAVKYAAYQHRWRPFWPTDGTLPASWRDAMAGAAARGILAAAQTMLR